MQKKKLHTVSAVAGLLSALSMAPASAVIIDYTAGPGLGISIPDGGYDGTLGSMVPSQIGVADTGTVNTITVDVGITHTWIGDLTVKLESPDGTLVTLLDRPGRALPDDGTGCCGSPADSSASDPITFDDTAVTPGENWDGTGGTYSPFEPLSGFSGTSLAGAWTLYVGDSATIDIGTLGSWAMRIDASSAGAPVPEPTTTALLALGLLGAGLGVRRRLFR